MTSGKEAKKRHQTRTAAASVNWRHLRSIERRGAARFVARKNCCKNIFTCNGCSLSMAILQRNTSIEQKIFVKQFLATYLIFRSIVVDVRVFCRRLCGGRFIGAGGCNKRSMAPLRCAKRPAHLLPTFCPRSRQQTRRRRSTFRCSPRRPTFFTLTCAARPRVTRKDRDRRLGARKWKMCVAGESKL